MVINNKHHTNYSMVKDMIDQQKIEKILTTLKESEKNRGLSIQEIINRTGFSRHTIDKYVGFLLGEKSIVLDCCGNNKLVCLNNSPPETKGGG
jgi:response regulator of citrate/malate metabolism